MEDIVEAIGKSQGTVKLSLSEAIPEVSVTEGDNKNTWHIVFNQPYRSLSYGRELTEWEAVKLLRQAKNKYKQLMNQVQREIDWINGVQEDENNTLQD